MTDFAIAAILTLAGLYAVAAWKDFRFGVLNRRRGRIKGSGWSRWAEAGWNAEDRRARRL